MFVRQVGDAFVCHCRVNCQNVHLKLLRRLYVCHLPLLHKKYQENRLFKDYNRQLMTHSIDKQRNAPENSQLRKIKHSILENKKKQWYKITVINWVWRFNNNHRYVLFQNRLCLYHVIPSIYMNNKATSHSLINSLILVSSLRLSVPIKGFTAHLYRL